MDKESVADFDQKKKKKAHCITKCFQGIIWCLVICSMQKDRFYYYYIFFAGPTYAHIFWSLSLLHIVRNKTNKNYRLQ